MRSWLIFGFVATITGCADAPSEQTQRELELLADEHGYESYDEMSGDIVRNIREAAGPKRGGETYGEYRERRDSYEGSRGSYGGYGCTQDCSGHEAGYNWAMEREIDDPDNCGGKSWSFEEGCRAYAEENGGY